MNFLRNLLASVLGFIIALFLFFFFVIAVTVSIGGDVFSVNKEAYGEVVPNTILKINLNTQIKDYAPIEMNPFDLILGINDEVLGLNTIITAIENAKYDINIKGISIQVKNLNAGVSQIAAIRKALFSFKESGKFVMAYGDVYGQKEYYLSSVADSLFVNPVGQIEFKGLASEVLFFKDFQDKYGVKMEVIRHGKYKSAVEPFLENKMSESNRNQLEELLQSLWSDIVGDISKSRNISFEDLNTIADNLKGRTAELAVENKLADGAVYRDIYNKKLKLQADSSAVSIVSLVDYINTGKGRMFRVSSNEIAVIYAQGDIIYGKGDENHIGQDMIIKELEKASENSDVKAIVLRVNSPGGSALASDLIWRAVALAKAEKPLVVSMGNLAASGGYYISCNADKIIAESTTITGSIGVFGMLPNVSKLTHEMGIYSEKVATNKNASYSVFNPMNTAFYEVTKEGVDVVYKTFVNRVSTGRGMTFDQVHALAQGRVWSGKQALENGLVDELGGLDVAVNAAASLANIANYKVLSYPSYEKDVKEMLKGIPFISSKNSLLKEWVGNTNFSLFQNINNLRNVKGIQARMPFVLDVK